MAVCRIGFEPAFSNAEKERLMKAVYYGLCGSDSGCGNHHETSAKGFNPCSARIDQVVAAIARRWGMLSFANNPSASNLRRFNEITDCCVSSQGRLRQGVTTKKQMLLARSRAVSSL
jgi:hypothetical protein